MTGPSVGSTFAGCRIEAVAGRGGMGVVFKATQVALDRPVALKAIAPDVALEPDFQERFKHEARLAASIDHPNVVPVYEAGEIEGQLYLVMRWVDGVDLRAMIDQGPLEPRRAARITAQVASALGAAHARGLLHRDVKPANILVASMADGEHAYLTDFGIARLEHVTSGLTRTGMMVGTIDYMAPERIEGATGDGRADVYSLGCALYEMLTGRPPYVRENEGARMYAHLSAEVPAAADARPQVPAALSDIARRAMAKDADERFQNAGEMARALNESVTRPSPAPPRPAPAPTVPAKTAPAPTRAADQPASKPPPAERAAPTEQPTGPTHVIRARRPLPLATVAAGVLVLVVAAVLVFASGSGDDEEPASASRPAAEVPIPVPGSPDGLAAAAGTIWAAGAKGGVVARVDAETGEPIGEPIPVGEDPDSLAVDATAAWVTNNDSGTVSRIDPERAAVVQEINVGEAPEGIALDADGAPWVAVIGEDGVRRIDPASNRPDPLVETGADAYAVLVDGETVWVANRGDGTVARLDRGGGEVERITVGGRPRAFAADGSSLWVIDFDGRLLELDRESGTQRDAIPLQGQPREMVAANGALWITLHRASRLARFDLSSRELTTRRTRPRPVGVTVAAGRIWVASHEASVVTPFEPSP